MAEVGYNVDRLPIVNLGELTMQQRDLEARKQQNAMVNYQAILEANRLAQQFKQEQARLQQASAATVQFEKEKAYYDALGKTGDTTIYGVDMQGNPYSDVSKGSPMAKGMAQWAGIPEEPSTGLSLPMGQPQPSTVQPNLDAYSNIAQAQGLDLNTQAGLSPERKMQVMNQLFKAKGLTTPSQGGKSNLPPGTMITRGPGGKTTVKGPTGGGFGAAAIALAREEAPAIAEAMKRGDVSGYLGSSVATKTMVAGLLSREKINVDDLVLGYGAEKTAIGNARIQDQKVKAAISAQTLLNAFYDAKTGEYKVPPTAHTELALAVARLISPQGVVAQDLVEGLRQGTIREDLASMAIWMGFDPKEVGGSTQSVVKMFAKLIEREGLASEKMRDDNIRGQQTSFKDMLKETKGQSPSAGQGGGQDSEYQKYLKAIGG